MQMLLRPRLQHGKTISVTINKTTNLNSPQNWLPLNAPSRRSLTLLLLFTIF